MARKPRFNLINRFSEREQLEPEDVKIKFSITSLVGLIMIGARGK